MDDNAVATASTANPRQQLADQVTKSTDASSGDAGAKSSVFAQLTGNPFFTAVCEKPLQIG